MKKKIILILCLIAFCSSLAYFYYRSNNPLLGKWESKKGAGIALVIDPKAPYTVIFKKNSMTIVDKVINIHYLLKTKKENIVYVKSIKNKDKLQIKYLGNDKIQFSLPGIGLRQYTRKDK